MLVSSDTAIYIYVYFFRFFSIIGYYEVLNIVPWTEWIKMWYTCIQNGIVLSHNKEWNVAICSNMDGPRGYHTKGSKAFDIYRKSPTSCSWLNWCKLVPNSGWSTK